MDTFAQSPTAPQRPHIVEIGPPADDDPRRELLRGLRGTPATIAPKFFYDRLGSRLFEAICELPEYYLPRAEREIFEARGAAIAAAVGEGCTLIDLGAGNCRKAERLFDLLRPAQYVAVDISGEHLREALDCLQDRHPRLDIVGVVQDFSHRLALPPPVRAERRLFFYPGSSIGNFTPAEATQFLARLRELGGRVLLGVDLVKERSVLEAAYDDPLGVTAAFNLNVLNNVNRIVGSDFDVRDWRHVALFNERESRIEMHLEAKKEISVSLPGGPRAFRAGERMLTENSYKLTPAAAAALAGTVDAQQTWLDAGRRFAVSLLGGSD